MFPQMNSNLGKNPMWFGVRQKSDASYTQNREKRNRNICFFSTCFGKPAYSNINRIAVPEIGVFTESREGRNDIYVRLFHNSWATLHCILFQKKIASLKKKRKRRKHFEENIAFCKQMRQVEKDPAKRFLITKLLRQLFVFVGDSKSKLSYSCCGLRMNNQLMS